MDITISKKRPLIPSFLSFSNNFCRGMRSKAFLKSTKHEILSGSRLLKINPTKTKVIIFHQKKSRKSAIDKHNFMVISNCNENIEIVNNYTYLGVKFSANGNFTNHKENLTEKTKRSFFAARRYLDFLKLPITLNSSIISGILNIDV